MVNPGFGRWALAIVLIALILALVTAATVVMASAILQPEVTPTIKVQPEVVRPGDIVVVTGRGWPGLANLVIVIALSPTRELLTETLVPVGAVPVAMDGTLTTSFVFPADVPWTAVREAWVVARPPTGNLQAVARLGVQPLRPTTAPTVAAAMTPMPGRQQVQGIIVQLAPELGLMVLQPFEGGANRGVVVRTAIIQFPDGRRGALADLKVGLNVAAFGWPDSGGTLLAEQVMILTGGVSLAPAAPQVVTATPAPTAMVLQPAAPAGVQVAAPVQPPAVVVCPPTPVVCLPAVPPSLQVAAPPDWWQGELFPNPWLAGPPVLVQHYRVIDFLWRDAPAPGLPRHGYSARWVGVFGFPRAGPYRFLLQLRGNARLWVDGQVLIDRWSNPPPGEYVAEVSLATGQHTLQLEFRDMGWPARLQLRWEYGGAVVQAPAGL